MPVTRVLLTPEEKRQQLRETQRKYYLKNKKRYLEYQRAYTASLDTTYTDARKRAIYKYIAKLKVSKLEN